jgi:hypothetical protein
MESSQNPLEIKLPNGFIFTQVEGEWIYKAEGVPFKKNVVERPAYKVIEEIEQNYLNYFEKMLKAAVGEINQEMKS